MTIHNWKLDDLVSLSEIAKLIPGQPSQRTIWRWTAQGCRGATLETIVVGGRRFSTKSAVERFIAATTVAATKRTIATDSQSTSSSASEEPKS